MVELIEIVEGSSSSSSSIAVHKHDVFLSFRGLDTRYSFTNHLHKALKHANITTFFDDEKIKTGEDLRPELENAIKESRASIIVLSKNYAYSSWCLDELVLILEQRLTSNQIVIPIFYHVEPTDIRKQLSSFGDAMIQHKQKMEAETNVDKRCKLAQKIHRWNKALTEVANLKAEDIKDRLETEFIDEIVRKIYRRLHVPLSCTLPQLVGMKNSIEFVTSWLKDDSSHSGDILTIFGMGGIGKTSLAKYVYWSHFREFDTSSYVEDISRRCAHKFNGLLDLQKQLYGDITRTTPIEVHDASMCTSQIESVIGGKKVFIVLDDIDSLEQLNALIGSRGFHQGSKVIITTKNAWLTESCKLFKTNVKPKHETYELKGLFKTESRILLCNHAFMCNDPKEGYEEVSENLVEYCEGHPLALEVLGNSLYNRNVAYWEECLEGLKKEIDYDISSVLRMSFDSLQSENDKELFKYIACFFVGKDRDVTTTILKACNINTRSGITNLIDRCLLSIGHNNELKMHQLVQEMGRFIVGQESPDKPWRRSLLWCHKESFKVLKQKKGTENIRGLTLDMRVLEKEKVGGSFELQTDALSKMDNLILLQLYYVQMNGSYKNFPEDLRWLCMQGFSLKSMPLDLPMENLVGLDMSYSNLESFDICYSNPKRKLFESSKKLIGSLKILNLSFCEQLCSVGGFVHFSSLEKLILRNCVSLVDVCESIEQCVDLVLVDLSYCNKLENGPRTISMLKNVRTLSLEGCNLCESETPDEMKDMDSLEMIKPDSKTSSSMFLDVIPRNLNFIALLLPKNLVSLSLAYCNLSTESFPMDFSCLSMLEKLYLDNNPIVSLPNCVRSLPRLKLLSMSHCAMLTSVEHPPQTLTDLILRTSSSDHLIKKVVFDPQMSPLVLSSVGDVMALSSFEFEGVVKIQPMIGVEEKVLYSLGWNNLEFLHEKRVQTGVLSGTLMDSDIQMYYEFGIFSTIYGGEEMPKWVSNRRKGPRISFTIPSSRSNLRGLNFCFVQTFPVLHESHFLPMIILSNITKNRTWIYEHYILDINVGGEYNLTLLSHWMFGMNEMEAGDQVTITVTEPHNQLAKKCGVSFAYDDGKTDEEEEEEDALDYYKSWNHIIGGDLTGFQTTTGEYILDTARFMVKHKRRVAPLFSEFVSEGARYKEEKVLFRALS